MNTFAIAEGPPILGRLDFLLDKILKSFGNMLFGHLLAQFCCS